MKLFKADVKLNKTLNNKYLLVYHNPSFCINYCAILRRKQIKKIYKSNAGGIIYFYKYPNGQNSLEQDRRFPKKSLQTGSPVGGWNAA